MVIPPESRDIRGFPYLDAQKGERPERRAKCPSAYPQRSLDWPQFRGGESFNTNAVYPEEGPCTTVG
jgi:hypothetical protein